MKIRDENDGILVKVKFALYLKELIGKSVIELKLSKNTSVGELINILKDKWPLIKKMDLDGEGPIILLLNNKPTSRIEKLKDGDEIEIIPPAIGG